MIFYLSATGNTKCAVTESEQCFPEVEANMQVVSWLQRMAAEYAGTCEGGGTNGEY
jgi:hypothetical protein